MTEPIVYTESEHYKRAYFGFWLYLLTDCVMFGALFASYIVLRNNTYGGPTAQDIFRIWHAFGITLLLLTTSLFAGLARVQAFRSKKYGTIGQFAITLVLGVWFVLATFSESRDLLARGISPQTSAFLSAYFTLVWTHNLHVIAAVIWTVIVILQLYTRGITSHTFRRLSLLTIFWQFLGLLWIFTYTIVYLFGMGGL